MDTKIIISVVDGEPTITYEPELKVENIGDYVSTLLTSLPALVLNVVSSVPMLRPVCEEEIDAHVYVFREGEEGKAENELYKCRKCFYDRLSEVFSAILTTGFRDIEYINECAAYQQHKIIDEKDNDYAETVKEVTKYVRENFGKIITDTIKDVIDEMMEEQKNEQKTEEPKE